MKAISLLFFILLIPLAHAKDYKLTKSEFLTRLDNGTLTTERSPIVAAAPNLVQQLIASQMKEFPGFKEEMFYAAYVKSTDFMYFVFYEWYDRGCIFGITEPKKYERTSSDEGKGSLATAENKSYEKIDKKYCEKALGISNLPSGGLVRVPGAIKPLKPKGK